MGDLEWEFDPAYFANAQRIIVREDDSEKPLGKQAD